MHVTKELGAGWQNDIAIRDQGTILRQASTNPPARAIVGAKGAFLIDTEGKQILDLHGSN